MPLRPIISTTNNYNFNLAKYLTTLLEKARTKRTTYIKDSFTFAKLIRQQKKQKNDCMSSLDVESLYINTPVHEAIHLAIKVIMKKKEADNQFAKLNENDWKHLFDLAVTNTPFRFYDELYLQVDGVSMGSPLAPILADIFTEHIEGRLEKFEDNNKIKFYLRYVEDAYIILNGKEIDIKKLLDYVNSLHSNLKFTNETEKDHQFSFLDVKVTRQRTKFETTIHRTKTHTGQLLNWSSCQAKKYNIALIKKLTFRALNICSSKILLTEECNAIEKALVKNGYPVNLVKKKS